MGRPRRVAPPGGDVGPAGEKWDLGSSTLGIGAGRVTGDCPQPPGPGTVTDQCPQPPGPCPAPAPRGTSSTKVAPAGVDFTQTGLKWPQNSPGKSRGPGAGPEGSQQGPLPRPPAAWPQERDTQPPGMRLPAPGRAARAVGRAQGQGIAVPGMRGHRGGPERSPGMSSAAGTVQPSGHGCP